MNRVAAVVALAAALALTTFAIVRGTWAVGGSDSSCYALMADALAHGTLQPYSDLAARAPWPNAPLTFAPAGFIPSPVRPTAASPICTPGFSLLLVPFLWLAGPDGIFFLTPIAAGLLVWCAFIAARNLSDSVGGAAAAVIVATTAIVLFQAVQPMNDILTAMLWVAVFAAMSGTPETRRVIVVGALTGLAILVRPNLAPLAVIVGIVVLRSGTSSFIRFLLAAAPGVGLVLLFNSTLYGHPLKVGYGNVGQMFGLDHIPTNLARYGRAFVETLTPFPLLAVAAPFALPPAARPRAWLALALAATTTAIYLLYDSYPEWWYLRFLLPALVLSIVLACAVLSTLLRRPVVVATLAAGLAAFGLLAARDRQAFDLQRLESRFRHGGMVVRDQLPPNAVLVTVWQSGTVRFHAQRPTVMWDALDPATLAQTFEWLRLQGLQPFILLERWEEPAFRNRFASHSAFGMLDWPPRIEVDRQVRIYAPEDREAYLAGKPITTEQLFPH